MSVARRHYTFFCESFKDCIMVLQLIMVSRSQIGKKQNKSS